jgi:DNA-binding ferritin-like protein
MSNAIQAREDYKAVAILQQQCLNTAELRSRIDHARKRIDAPDAARIHALLTGLHGELAAVTRLLEERIGTLSPGYAQPQRSHAEQESFWQLFRTDGSDCSGHLEALLAGYLRYARATSDSIAFLQTLGDEESVELMNLTFDAADRSIWFLEFYMEGLALRMDLEHLPEFAPTVEG